MALKGNLKTFLLTSILQLLHNDRKTGALHLTNGEEEVKVIFKEGTIVYAMSSQKSARLGNFLVGRGVLSLELLEECLAEGRQKKLALGKVVVERGIITSEVLTGFIHRQVEEVIYGLFLWESGEFTYQDTQLDLSGLVVTQLDLTTMMLEASRRIDEMSVLRKQIPSNTVIFRLSGKVRNPADLDLSSEEWRVLGLVNGRRSVDQLVTESRMDKFAVYKVLYSLSSSGVVEKVEELPPERPRTDGDFSAVITGYNNILQIMWRNLEPEVGHDTMRIFDECKPESVTGQRDLFKNYHPNNPLPANIYVMRDNLNRFVDLKNEFMFLVESFNRYVLNILEQVPDILGRQPTRQMMEEIEKMLPYLKRYLKDLAGKANVTDDIRKITARVEQGLSDQEEGKSGGFFFKRKK